MITIVIIINITIVIIIIMITIVIIINITIVINIIMITIINITIVIIIIIIIIMIINNNMVIDILICILGSVTPAWKHPHVCLIMAMPARCASLLVSGSSIWLWLSKKGTQNGLPWQKEPRTQIWSISWCFHSDPHPSVILADSLVVPCVLSLFAPTAVHFWGPVSKNACFEFFGTQKLQNTPSLEQPSISSLQAPYKAPNAAPERAPRNLMVIWLLVIPCSPGGFLVVRGCWFPVPCCLLVVFLVVFFPGPPYFVVVLGGFFGGRLAPVVVPWWSPWWSLVVFWWSPDGPPLIVFWWSSGGPLVVPEWSCVFFWWSPGTPSPKT